MEIRTIYNPILALLGILGVISLAFAAAQFTMNLNVTNPNSYPMNNTIATFNFPSCLNPLTIDANMTWNPGTRVLTVSMGTFGANETRAMPMSVEATSSCTTQGQIVGEITYTSTTLPPPPTPSPGPAPIPSPTPGPGGGPAPAPGVVFLPAPLENIGRQLRENPVIVNTARNIAVPVSAAVGVVSVVAVATNVVAAGYSVIMGWLHIFRFFFFFITNKKRPAWGSVVNQWTKKPIAGVSISIIETTFRKIKETQITDKSGRFGFLVSPGRYSLRIVKPGFETKESAILEVGKEPEKLNLQLGLVESKTALERGRGRLRHYFQAIAEFINLINPYALSIGTVVSLIVLIILPTTINLVMLLVYLALDVIKLALSLRSVRSYGLVVDRSTGAPLALSVVRLYHADKNLLVATRVTNEQGRFNFLLLPGEYYITCVKDSYGEVRTDILEIKKEGLVTQVLEMSPSAPPASPVPPTPPAPPQQ